MKKEDWEHVSEILIEVVDSEGGDIYRFPIHCPRWLFWLLEKLEIR